MKKRILREEVGQALIESSFAFVMLSVLVFGVVDFGRALYDIEVMNNVAAQGSNAASRGTGVAATAQAVTTYAASTIDIQHQGCVIVTAVTNDAGTLSITDQATQCGIVATSKVGCLKGVSGCNSSTPTLPVAAATALQSEVSGSSLYVTEVFYTFTTSTPIASLLQGNTLPGQLYSAAYY